MANNNNNNNSNSKKMFLVKNRSASRVLYQIPSMNIRREFAPGETMKISYDELVKFMYEPGAKKLMVNFLQIQEEQLLKEFNMPVQPEYYLSEQQIKDLLLTGSMDAFLDCLDFAPEGVLQLVKNFAVSLPLTDYEKRKALKEKTGFDVDKALVNKEAEVAESKESEVFTPITNSTERPKAVAPVTRRTSGAAITAAK